MDKIKEVLSNKVSRRRFMAGVGAGVGATAAVALAAGCSNNGNSSNTNPAPVSTTPAPTDVDILNFALSLEYLGAEYYMRGVTGTGLSSADTLSSAGTVTGGAQVPGLSASIFGGIAIDFANDELGHVRALQAAITNAGGTPAARPQIDFTDAFNGLAVSAGLPGGTFNPFDSVSDFILGAFVFEDVDVTAYTGAAPLISSSAILSAAAGIQAIEAYHAGCIRTLIVGMDANNGNSNLTTMANMISTVRGMLGGGSETTLSTTSIVAASSNNAIGFGRTTDQVLHVVYATGGGAGVTKGGFFPAGLNGTITATAS